MPPRRLSPPERAVWGHVAATVTPLAGKVVEPVEPNSIIAIQPALRRRAAPSPLLKTSRSPLTPDPTALSVSLGSAAARPRGNTLDANWDKRLSKGMVSPDRVIDLHGDTLNTAHFRLNHALGDAVQCGDRLILLVTGKSPRENARMPPTSRGVIRQSISDWLASSSHASKIAAVRNAHPRHGGAGALYVIMRRPR